MALIRFAMLGAIPDTLENRQKLEVLRPALQKLKEVCVIINEGEPNEEDITRFTWHLCHHDTDDQPCEPEQEI